MRLSFTGTREGMTAKQIAAVTKLVKDYKPDWCIHGDCIGADTDFHRIVISIRGGYTVLGPPHIRIWPSTSHTRAFNEGAAQIMPKKAPLERDWDIARDGDRLIATPKGPDELRSGTWATIRYAKRLGKMVDIIMPDGSMQ